MQRVDTSVIRVEKDSAGDTELHRIIRDSSSLSEITQWIEGHPHLFLEVIKMTGMVNNIGQTPLYLLHHNPLLDEHAKAKLSTVLANLHRRINIRPLEEKLDASEVIEANAVSVESEMAKWLTVAVDAINYLIGLNIQSSTHPLTPEKGENGVETISNKIHGMRVKVSAKRYKILSSAQKNMVLKKQDQDTSIVSIDFDKQKMEQAVDAAIDIYNKTKLGNCLEQSVVTYDYLRKHLDDTITCEIFRYLNSDHVFVVIGRNPASRACEPLTWGKNAIVIDPLLREVFHAKFIHAKLKSYVCLYNQLFFRQKLIVDYNPHYHLISAIYPSNRIDFKFNLSNPFMCELFREFSQTEKYAFYMLQDNLKEALKNKVVTEEQIKKLKNKKTVLFNVFRNEHGLRGLNLKLFTLMDMDLLPDHAVKRLVTGRGINKMANDVLIDKPIPSNRRDYFMEIYNNIGKPVTPLQTNTIFKGQAESCDQPLEHHLNAGLL